MTLNTTKKGNLFEEKSLEILEKALSEGQLGLMKDLVKIRKKQKYYSQLRKSDIEVDLAIEVWIPGAEKYSLLYLIECKDYKSRVPVSKLETFHSQIIQLNAHKGIFVSNSPLHKGGMEVANSLNIMFIQGESSENYKIILHKTNKNNKTDGIPQINKNNNVDEGLLLIEKILDNEILNAFNSEIDEKHVSYGIEKLSSDNIENICNEILDDIDPLIRNECRALQEKQLINNIERKHYFNVEVFDNNENKLGYCDFENNLIGLNSTLNLKNRKIFVLAHEFGHAILHSKLNIGQNSYERFEDSSYNFKTGKNALSNPKHWIEWQANYFAECLLLSKPIFMYQLQRSLTRNGFPVRKIYVDDQPDNIKRFEKIISELSNYFSVSKTTIIYKLKSINMLVDNSNLKSIGQIINENELYI